MGKAKPTQRRRAKPTEQETVSYIVEILDWDWSFLFGISPTVERDGPYWDHRHLDPGQAITSDEGKSRTRRADLPI